jgi:hypothetical protein
VFRRRWSSHQWEAQRLGIRLFGRQVPAQFFDGRGNCIVAVGSRDVRLRRRVGALGVPARRERLRQFYNRIISAIVAGRLRGNDVKGFGENMTIEPRA